MLTECIGIAYGSALGTCKSLLPNNIITQTVLGYSWGEEEKRQSRFVLWRVLECSAPDQVSGEEAREVTRAKLAMKAASVEDRELCGGGEERQRKQ